MKGVREKNRFVSFRLKEAYDLFDVFALVRQIPGSHGESDFRTSFVPYGFSVVRGKYRIFHPDDFFPQGTDEQLAFVIAHADDGVFRREKGTQLVTVPIGHVYSYCPKQNHLA